MSAPIEIDEMISELEKMKAFRVRSSAEVLRRTEVFAATVVLLKRVKAAGLHIHGDDKSGFITL